MGVSGLERDDWCAAQAAALPGGAGDLARVTAVDRGSYLIRNRAGEVRAELAGRLAYRTERPEELPCVGDWVSAQYHDGDPAAVIQAVLPRRSFLRRKTAGSGVEFQMIAANLDAAFIVQSCQFDFNPRRLDRYLVMAADGGVEPIVVLTKTDLVGGEELARQLAAVRSAAPGRVLALSSVTGSGWEEFQRALCHGRTYCLLGSSGVGKTTLLNRLLGREAFDTRPVSGTGEGTHTTARRQLVLLSQGAILIDTPGMRELGLVSAGEGIRAGFDDLVGLAEGCRYADCRHEQEPGCAVRAAIERGDLSPERHASYLKLRKESDHNQMSHLDKRRKDRAFGRFIKSVKKQVKD